ncbi:ATP-binding protein [Asticcacaulis sp. AND118]|uniref:ATP-binding protein n=1 Tax=Asticcacaulis sp. AND118 TaxID=2840468 RepID=UPI001D0010F4|nr:ATP-binding protein [Asticcacaulis sp. AND118]UDF04986.1 HAMP domain-containing protein [Asticcacaulis sp. AND118]
MATFRNPLSSLWGQTLFGTLGLILLGQIVTLALVFAFIVLPQTRTFARIAGDNLANTVLLLQTSPESQRPKLLSLIRASAEIEFRSSPPPDARPAVQHLQRRFMMALVNSLRERGIKVLLVDNRQSLVWVELSLDSKPTWMSLSPRAAHPVGWVALALVMLAIFLAVLATLVMHTVIMNPLDRLRSMADSVHESSGPVRISEDGPSELAALGRSFNAMVLRREQADLDRNLLLAGISHDLRTPLSRLRLAFEMSGMSGLPYGALAERQIDRIQTILSQFMCFARGYDSEPLTSTDPQALILDIIRDFEDCDVHFSVTGIVPRLAVRREALSRALINLIENALKYGVTPVEIALRHEEESVIFAVRDQGPGMAKEEAARLRRPFVRGGTVGQESHAQVDVPGTGLGLALVDKIAQLHFGRLEFEQRDYGFEARLVMPVRQQTAEA